MATPTYILPGNGIMIVEENTSSAIEPVFGQGIVMGTVVAAPPTREVAVGQVVMYNAKNAFQFKQNGNQFQAVSVEFILLTDISTPS